MALCLEGKAAKGQIWVGFSSVISQETPIPLAPCSEAAQPNHGNPSACGYPWYTQNFTLIFAVVNIKIIFNNYDYSFIAIFFQEMFIFKVFT